MHCRVYLFCHARPETLLDHYTIPRCDTFPILRTRMKTILAALHLTSGLHRSLSSLTIGALAYLC